MWYDTAMQFKDKLRQLRKKKGMSATDLARICGITDNAIRQLELGNSKVPTFVVGVRLAQALGVTPEELLEEEAKMPFSDRMNRFEEVLEKVVLSQGHLQAELEALQKSRESASPSTRRLPQAKRAQQKVA